MADVDKQVCPVCKWSYRTNKDGSIRKHGCEAK